MTLAAETLISPTDEASTLNVQVVSDYRSFLDLEPVWNRLVEEAGIDHPFLSHEWVRTWWDSFGVGKELHILVVKAGTKPIAIAPLMLDSGRMYGVRVRRLQGISNDHTQRFDFILAQQPKEACQAIWQHLVSRPDQWDVLELQRLPAGSRALELFPLHAEQDGYLFGLCTSTGSPYVPIRQTWDHYVNSLDRKHRSNLRNRLKRLSRLGQVSLEVITSDDQLDNALEEGLQIEAAAWKGRAGTAIRNRPELRTFYCQFAKRAAQRGWLRLHFLTVDRRRIAFQYSLCYRNKLYLLKPGYDPHYAPYSPSNLLCEKVLHEAFEQSLAAFDFLGVAENWKLEWTKIVWPHSWLFAFPNRRRTRLLHWTMFRLIPRLRRHRLYPALRWAVLKLGVNVHAK